MGNMNIAEKRIPQDGHIESQIDGKSLDIRLSSLPTVYGEKMVIRLLGHSLQQLTTLKDLGLQPKDYDLMESHDSSTLRHSVVYRPDRQRQNHDAACSFK